LDGTLVDSVYPRVLAWREALEEAGIELSVWRIHRRIGMSGGLFVNALLRETGHKVSAHEAVRLQDLHAQAYLRQVKQVRPLPGAPELLNTSLTPMCRGPSQPADGWKPRSLRWKSWE
jgi:beta-phosphoglucomutase-like phosphatase (HAD superfamily)